MRYREGRVSDCTYYCRPCDNCSSRSEGNVMRSCLSILELASRWRQRTARSVRRIYYRSKLAAYGKYDEIRIDVFSRFCYTFPTHMKSRSSANKMFRGEVNTLPMHRNGMTIEGGSRGLSRHCLALISPWLTSVPQERKKHYILPVLGTLFVKVRHIGHESSFSSRWATVFC